ncbi:MAG: uracil-DNA glycosylase [Erythrobacter sp.]
MADANIPESWRDALDPVLETPEARQLGGWLKAEEDAGKTVYPPGGQRLAALALTPLESVRVVILGQDPYHGPGQAHGLAFSVPEGEAPPPSLRNIFQELVEDCGVARPTTGDLTPWARQGVLLLNTCLTVEAGRAGSHAGRGWEVVTDAVLRAVAHRETPTVFILWGGHARKVAQKVLPSQRPGMHLILTSPHPSPLSAYRGFFGSRPFSQANDFLEAKGRGTIDWSLP